MTYLQFLAVFLAAPIGILLLVLRHDLRSLPWLAIGTICLIALIYTTPWDNLLILNGVWTYPPRRVLNIVFGVAPLEEYSFFVLQTILTSLFALLLLKRPAKAPAA
ncbi:MAG: lycopene cyclase domain-containing protein [Chloroflexota bacterium]